MHLIFVLLHPRFFLLLNAFNSCEIKSWCFVVFCLDESQDAELRNAIKSY